MEEEKKVLDTHDDVTFSPLRLHVDWFMITFWGIVILAFFLRFYDLASKPLHHDEGLYGVYCWRFFTGSGYKYEPMMHGPFMFHFQLILFFLFGVGDFSVRIAPALFGTLMVAGTYFLKNHLGKIGALSVALLFALSPTHLYFSRFMRHDVYIAFFTFASVVFSLLYARSRQNRYFYLTIASLALMFCVKENAYIHAFIFMTFILCKDLLSIFWLEPTSVKNQKRIVFLIGSLGFVAIPVLLLGYFLRHPLPSLLGDLMSPQKWAVFMLVVIHFAAAGWVFFYWLYREYSRPFKDARDHLITFIIGTFLFLWIYIFLYSTFFTNRIGVLDGVAKSWIYWWNQHSIQRIKGPFHYYVPFIGQYELPVFLIAVGGLLYNIANTLNKKIIVAWAVIFPPILIWLYGDNLLPLWLAFTHMEVWIDLVITLWVVGIGLWGMLHFMVQRRWFTAFLIYWSGMGFLIYCYAGEKVPWLFLHILVPVVLLAGVFVQQLFESKFWQSQKRTAVVWMKAGIGVAIALFAGYTLHCTILLNYYNPANPVETMVYTQTSTDILKMVKLVEDIKFGIGAEEAKKPIIAVQGNAVWPLHWYLRDYEGWFHPGDITNVQRPIIVVDWEECEKYREILGENYQEIRVKLREWWIPKPEATFTEWFKYFVFRKVFNPTGSSDIALYIKISYQPSGEGDLGE